MDAVASSHSAHFRVSMVLGATIFMVLAYITRRILKVGVRPHGFPPGPPTRPLWGNLKEINTLRPHLTYTEWSKTYGPVFTVMRGTTPVLVVNSAAAAHDIFNKRGQATAGRPSANKVDMVARGGYAPALMTGAPWRSARRMWHAILNVGAARSYLPYQKLEAAKLIADVCDDSIGGAAQWREHVARFSNSVGMTMMNGRRVPTKEDPGIKEVMDDLLQISTLQLKTEWMDSIDWVWKLPGRRWWLPPMREAERLGVKHERMLKRHWENAKGWVENGEKFLPNFITAIQQKLKDGWEGLTETEGMEVANELLVAATDTTASSLNNFLAAMALWPDIQRKAQEEIDRVVGPDRLPNEEDAIGLPYTRQCIQELQRWISVAPLALPHATTAPMQLGEYHVPADTIVLLNVHGIHRDPEAYPDPKVFKPERWEGKLETVLSDEQVGARTDLFAFGAGRRVCPGQHVAEQNLFFVISHWLWAFDVQKKKDPATGKEIDIDMDDVRPGLVNTMNPYEVEVKPRSRERAEWIKANWKKQRETLLDEDEQWLSSPEAVEKIMARTAK